VGQKLTVAITDFGASAVHSRPQFPQRSFTTITPARSQVPAENGHPEV
jgi:hypothetical protein